MFVAIFFLFLMVGGVLWSLLLRSKRGDKGKSFKEARAEKKKGAVK